MKALLLLVLAPLAALVARLAGVQRLWHHACLRAGVSRLAANTVVMGAVELHGNGRIEIGSECLIYPGLYLETDAEGRIALGNRCVLSRGVHLSSRSAIILGDGCMIGEYVSIRDANHHYGNGLMVRDSGFSTAAITLGRNVWIGRGAVILPGVSIGDNTVIAANAVVNRSLPADVLAGGVPAKVLRKLAGAGHD